MVNVNINGKDVQVEEGTSILNAAKKLNIKIPGELIRTLVMVSTKIRFRLGSTKKALW